jgi:hypothetical protein
MEQNGSALTHLTKCRLCHKDITQGSEVGPPIIGENQANKKRQKYAEVLKGHLAKEHREKVVDLLGAGGEFMELLGSMYFETTDPTINKDMERIRAVAHRTTRKIYMPDPVIDDGVARLNLNPHDEELVKLFCKQMRDALCEEGQYSHEIFQTPKMVV